MFEFEYRRLGEFTYHVLSDPRDIKNFLVEWLEKEWSIDHEEFPDQVWTIEWLSKLPMMKFTLEVLELDAINPRPDLMGYCTDTYDFMKELQVRANEREESSLRGVSTEPLVVNWNGLELMDGYTRYTVLKKHSQKKVLAYVGITDEDS